MKQNSRLYVLENRPISSEVFILTLGSEEKLPEIKAGQFANVLIENSPKTFLRRPLSIHDVDYVQNSLKLYIQKKGEGTKSLSKLTTEDSLDILFPLGNGFNYDHLKKSENPEVLLVGGGCGVAPLLYLAKCLSQINIRPVILIGGRSRSNILRVEDYVKYGKVLVMTEDGSLGDKGLVTEHPIFQQQKFDQIYCCGPDPMMKAVALLAKEKNTPCQVSLENMMACGIGACLCCVTETKEGHRCVCTDGPVFDGTDLY